ncbi:MAG: hypothetical protein JST75_07225 [Bacteroidetes bacterium]|nr:hypothetical protein [Bacteroidota bacterium]
MKKYLILFFLMNAYHLLNAQQSPDNISGTYFLQGVMETASVLELKPDSSFDFFYSYGAVDRYGTGKWSMHDNEIILNSRKRPAIDFKMIESKITSDSVVAIQIIEKNKMLLSYVQCVISTSSGEYEISTNSDGVATFPRQSLTKISLLFRLCPDRYSTFNITNTNNNFFQFGFEPWIAEIFFDHLKLISQHKSLTGSHPLLKGENFKYSKE